MRQKITYNKLCQLFRLEKEGSYVSDKQDFEQLAKLGSGWELDAVRAKLQKQAAEQQEKDKQTVDDRMRNSTVKILLQNQREHEQSGRIKRFEYMHAGFDKSGYLIHGSAKLTLVHFPFDKSGYDANLDAIGEAGWEMCAAIQCRQNCTECTDYYFKREIKDF